MCQVANERLGSPRKLNPSVPRDLETIVMKAASHDAADRYATAGEMASDLEAFLSDRPIQARQLSKIGHAIRWCRRNRLMAGLAASVMFLLATVFGVTLAGYSHSEQQRQASEKTSKRAVDVLDEIYMRFASSDLSMPMASNTESGEEQLLGHTPLPLSKDVAFMLDNLLQPFATTLVHARYSLGVFRYSPTSRKSSPVSFQCGGMKYHCPGSQGAR